MIRGTSLQAREELFQDNVIETQVQQIERHYRETPEGLADFQIKQLLNIPLSTCSARRNDIPFEFEENGKIMNPFTGKYCIRWKITNNVRMLRKQKNEEIRNMCNEMLKGNLSYYFGTQKILKLIEN